MISVPTARAIFRSHTDTVKQPCSVSRPSPHQSLPASSRSRSASLPLPAVHRAIRPTLSAKPTPLPRRRRGEQTSVLPNQFPSHVKHPASHLAPHSSPRDTSTQVLIPAQPHPLVTDVKTRSAPHPPLRRRPAETTSHRRPGPLRGGGIGAVCLLRSTLLLPIFRLVLSAYSLRHLASPVLSISSKITRLRAAKLVLAASKAGSRMVLL